MAEQTEQQSLDEEALEEAKSCDQKNDFGRRRGEVIQMRKTAPNL